MVCVYCRQVAADTEDHVVPESFFDQPPESGYIKVPACYSCNNGHSRDEEYFLVVVLGEATLESASANKVLTRIGADHASGRRKRIGLAKALLEKLRAVDAYSPGGIFLRAGKGIELDVQRVNRVLQKIVRGLFYHEFGTALPTNAAVFVEIKPELDHLRWPPVAATLAQQPTVVGSAFSYRVLSVPQHPTSTCWALEFYESVPAIAITGELPRELPTN